MYAILDIEATGGNAFTDKITEIAIYLHDGTQVIDLFTTLINPERTIPEFVSNLTGISDTMVSTAPRFADIADQLIQFTEGKILVAHNALNDYSFIRHEFRTIGYEYKRDTLCTQLLSRKFLPGKNSYSLGKLCRELNIDIKDRHRAMDDAFATVKLFELILNTVDQPIVNAFIVRQEKEIPIPQCIRPEVLASLPVQPGIFYLFNGEGILLYVHKTHNLRKGVIDFVVKTKGKKGNRIRTQLHDIKYEATGIEAIAAVRETEEIKKLHPKYNRIHPAQVRMKVLPGINSALLFSKGRSDNERSMLLIKQGRFCGYGFLPQDSNDWNSYINPISNGTHFHGIISRMLKHRNNIELIRL